MASPIDDDTDTGTSIYYSLKSDDPKTFKRDKVVSIYLDLEFEKLGQDINNIQNISSSIELRNKGDVIAKSETEMTDPSMIMIAGSDYRFTFEIHLTKDAPRRLHVFTNIAIIENLKDGGIVQSEFNEEKAALLRLNITFLTYFSVITTIIVIAIIFPYLPEFGKLRTETESRDLELEDTSK